MSPAAPHTPISHGRAKKGIIVITLLVLVIAWAAWRGFAAFVRLVRELPRSNEDMVFL
jgi:hypothetical protein